MRSLAIVLSGVVAFSTLWALPVLPARAAYQAMNTREARGVAYPIDQLLQAQQHKQIREVMVHFHPQARLFWSNGKFLQNLSDIQQAYQQSFLAYRDFKGNWAPDVVDISGDQAWTTGETSWSFVDIASGQPLHLTVRSTFVLKKVQGQWKILFEHSSHRRSD